MLRRSKKDQLQREVGIFEQLASRFAVTGTNIETNADGWQPAQSCPKQQCEEPFVHTSGGVPVNQFAISFVNHAQLRRGIPSPDAISAAHHSLAADHAEDHMEDRAEADAEDHVQDHVEADAEDHMQDHAEGDAEDHMQDHAEADAKDHMQDHAEADAEDHMEDHAEADAEEHSGDHADDEEDTA
eukprot:s531_g16.t1